MPAEWYPHEGTWFSWPHNLDTWRHHLPAAERALADAVKWLSAGETVHINVQNAHHQSHVQRVLERAAVSGSVKFHCFPTNDSWCRDHGATFLCHPSKDGYAAIDWGYNAWGGKYPPFDLDNEIPRLMCEAMGAQRFSTPLILEGGSIEVNGAGVVLTTETCLLNLNRNPGLTKTDLELLLREMLGVEKVLWIGGELVGDDTDGHIDNLARFVNEDTIVVPLETNPKDPNYASLRDNYMLLQSLSTIKGMPFKVIPLPMPAPFFIDRHRMPANYANFYIGNEVLLVPAFGDPKDQIACDILAPLFPDREVFSVDCSSIIWGLGALHCLSQQVPRPANLSGTI